MENLMRKSWWKVAAVSILLYGLIAGMLIPLKPNLISVSPRGGELGTPATFEVVGYNTRFTEEEGDTRAWLNLEADRGLAATRVEAIDDRRARLTFDLPDHLPLEGAATRSPSLIVSGPANGSFVVPDAVTLRQNEGPTNMDATERRWEATAIRGSDLFASTTTTFPFRSLLAETIRNTYFHVSLWFAMMFLYIAAVVYAVKHLRRHSRHEDELDLPPVMELDRAERYDNWTVSFTAVGTLFGVLGLLTGAVWAKYTWGSFWNWDIKQFTTLVALLIYAGYFVLRATVRDPERRGRLSAAYNIFAFVCLIPLIYILPRLSTTSLHPGAEGNPALGGEDLDNTMRMVFYPVIIGWTLFGGWMAGLSYRTRTLAQTFRRRRLEANY